MNRRLGIVCIAIVASIFGVAFFLTNFSPVQPQFQGRSLDAWLADLRSGSPPLAARAQTALQQMRPSPAPILVRRLRATDSPFRRIGALFHLPGTLPSSYQIRGEAMAGLMALGPAAKPVIPELAKLIRDPEEGQGVTAVLARLGPESVPYLVSAVTNPPPATNARMQMRMRQAQQRLLLAVGAAGTNSAAAVPLLLANLQSPDSNARMIAIISLGRLHDPPAEARTAIFQMLRDTNETVRQHAAKCLTTWDRPGWRLRLGYRASDYDPIAAFNGAKPIDVTLSDALIAMAEHDTDNNSRDTAVACLLVVDPKGALNAFLEGLQSSDVDVRRHCAWNFMQFKKGARGAVPALLKCLDDPDAKVQQNAAVSLREIAEQPEKAVPALMAKLNDPNPESREIFGIALSGFGAKAKAAVPQIVELLKAHTNDFYTEGLVNALDRIDPATLERLQTEAETNGAPR